MPKGESGREKTERNKKKTITQTLKKNVCMGKDSLD